MAAINEEMLVKGINLSRKQQWKDSPTTQSYTDFSKMDFDNIAINDNVDVEGTGLINSIYDNSIADQTDPMLDVNEKLHNFSMSIDIVGDNMIKFEKNDSIIGLLKINVVEDSKLSIDLGEYKFLNLILVITLNKGVHSKISIKSDKSGLSYIRMKQILHESSKLYMLNRHIKDGFMFLRGDADLERGADFESKLYLYADDKAHYDAMQNVLFVGEKGKAAISGKGVVNEESAMIFRGVLNMYTEDCYGSFDTKTLNISEGRALTDSVPAMDIGTNNVIAKHSSAIENIDEGKLFYIMAKGLDKEEGKNLIIESFLDSTTD